MNTEQTGRGTGRPRKEELLCVYCHRQIPRANMVTRRKCATCDKNPKRMTDLPPPRGFLPVAPPAPPPPRGRVTPADTFVCEHYSTPRVPMVITYGFCLERRGSHRTGKAGRYSGKAVKWTKVRYPFCATECNQGSQNEALVELGRMETTKGEAA